MPNHAIIPSPRLCTCCTSSFLLPCSFLAALSPSIPYQLRVLRFLAQLYTTRNEGSSGDAIGGVCTCNYSTAYACATQQRMRYLRASSVNAQDIRRNRLPYRSRVEIRSVGA